MSIKKISIIVPVFNESDNIDKQLDFLSSLKNKEELDIVFSDGGSQDDTVEKIKRHNFAIVHSAKGRAIQMNTAAQWTQGEILLFLHCDTQLPSDFTVYLNKIGVKDWGFFSVKLSGHSHWFRIIGTMMNWRTRATSVATGDHCIFMGRDLFQQLDGYAEIPLMEDVEISKRLREICAPVVVDEPVTADSRRWKQYGILNTMLLMWCLRLQYFFGVSPEKLVKKYYP